MKTETMSAGVLSVYQVDGDPDHLLLVDRVLRVINGAYRLTRMPNGDVIIPGNQNCRLVMAGFIRVMELDMSWGSIDYNKVLSDFRDGQRATLTACPTCGREFDA